MIDLHMHTTYSDGTDSVEQLLNLCEKEKLEVISITDHNTCNAYEEDCITKIFSGDIIPGIELTANYHNRVIEILGYGINTKQMNDWCRNQYSEEKKKKEKSIIYDRILAILEKKQLIYDKEKIALEDLNEDFFERYIWDELKRYPENKARMEEELWQNYSMFFRKGLAKPESDWYLGHAKFYPEVKQIVDTIHKMGGKAFLAHAYQYKFANTLQVIDDLHQNTSLDGYECHYSNFTKEETDEIVSYVKEHQLLQSGGSDYHGKRKPEISLGIGKGNLVISKEIIEDWKKK